MDADSARENGAFSRFVSWAKHQRSRDCLEMTTEVEKKVADQHEHGAGGETRPRESHRRTRGRTQVKPPNGYQFQDGILKWELDGVSSEASNFNVVFDIWKTNSTTSCWTRQKHKHWSIRVISFVSLD